MMSRIGTIPASIRRRCSRRTNSRTCNGPESGNGSRSGLRKKLSMMIRRALQIQAPRMPPPVPLHHAATSHLTAGSSSSLGGAAAHAQSPAPPPPTDSDHQVEHGEHSIRIRSPSKAFFNTTGTGGSDDPKQSRSIPALSECKPTAPRSGCCPASARAPASHGAPHHSQGRA